MPQMLRLIVWALAIPLILYCAVLFLTLLAFRHPQKGTVIKTMWSEVWLLGLLANLGGGLWMLLVRFFLNRAITRTENAVLMLTGVIVTGACLYFVELQALRTGGLLSTRERRITAMALAITGAPYFFVVPL